MNELFIKSFIFFNLIRPRERLGIREKLSHPTRLAPNRNPHPLPPFQYVILLKKRKKKLKEGGLGQNPQKIKRKATKTETEMTKGNSN